MSTRSRPPRAMRRIAAVASAALATAIALPLGAAAASGADPTGALAGSTLYTNPFSTTLEAAQGLGGQARADAYLLGSIPSAEWLTKGTPEEVQADAAAYVGAAAAAGQMPVVVVYNLPFRDCAQYSAGGALDTGAYKDWIDGVAAGIGSNPATIILEPDGLGIIPWHTNLDGSHDWCQPTELIPETATADRYTQLNYAVDTLGALAGTSVYLDGTHSGWLNVGEITDRLLKGGVQKADGFFLNASNYNFTTNLTFYGTWVSSCIALVTEHGASAKDDCPNQYWAGGPSNNWGADWPAGFSGALSNFGEWSVGNADPALDATGPVERYAQALGSTVPSTHFVIDTSRNGQGPWSIAAGTYPDNEDWCNPPGRGLGAAPTTNTGHPLVDAYLWIKVPGESDGKCYRGTGGPLDPARGIEDPAAGQWFAEQARELISLANPGLAPLACTVDWSANGSGKASSAQVRLAGEVGSRWTLSFAVRDGQVFTGATNGTVTQSGGLVTVSGTLKGKGNAPDTVIHAKGAATEPWLFRLNGQPCLSM